MAAAAAAAGPAALLEGSSRKRKTTSAPQEWTQLHGVAKLDPGHKAICQICLSIMIDPHLVPPCALHVFCKQCLSTALARKLECPSCRKPVKVASDCLPLATTNPLGYDAIFGSLQMHCPLYFAIGCEWRGDYTGMADHIRTTCLVCPLPCPHCKSDIARGQLEEHKANCLERTLPCGHCKGSIVFKDMDRHVAEKCPHALLMCVGGGKYVPVRDPSPPIRSSSLLMAAAIGKLVGQGEEKTAVLPISTGCGMVAERQDLKAHWRSACPKARARCPLKGQGCGWKGARELIDQHCTENAVAHVKLLSTALACLSGAVVPRLSSKQSRILVIGGRTTGNADSGEVYQLGVNSSLPWSKLLCSLHHGDVSDSPAIYFRDWIYTGHSFDVAALGKDIAKGLEKGWIYDDTELDSARRGFVAIECRGAMYVIGGYDTCHDDDDAKRRKKMPTCCKDRQGNWDFTLPPMATERRTPCAVAFREKIFVFGGYGADTDKVLRSAECFDVTTKVWSAVADLPAARDEASAIVDPKTGRIFVLGGCDAKNEAVASVFEYDCATNKWVEASWKLPGPRKEFAAHLVRDQLFVIGGRGRHGSALASCIMHSFDDDGGPDDEKHWEELPSLPVPLCGFGSLVMGPTADLAS